MRISREEKTVLRELAARYAELAALPVQQTRRERARNINDLIPQRPIVWIHEIPWHEMDIDGELRLVCQDDFTKNMEWFFRSALFRWKYFQADMIIENEFPIAKSYSSTGIGLAVAESTLSMDNQNHIVSHEYADQLDTIEKVSALRIPTITANNAHDEEQRDMAQDILDGILPVRLHGQPVYHVPWDTITRYRGVTAIMIDLIEQPELMHATINKFTEIGHSQMKQMESLGLLDGSLQEIHCTPAYVSDLAPEQSCPAALKNTWFRGAAQMFSDISPAMHEEFDLQYMKPLMAECGLVYYGCCEALDRKIALLKQIPNLRKIGVSPWANPGVCAEQIGGGYVFSHKPNPALVSGTFDPDAVRREITRIVEICRAHHCPYEFILKDISTVSYRPGNLIEWNKTVQEVLDRYYT